jgi:hypothetical protein
MVEMETPDSKKLSGVFSFTGYFQWLALPRRQTAANWPALFLYPIGNLFIH